MSTINRFQQRHAHEEQPDLISMEAPPEIDWDTDSAIRQELRKMRAAGWSPQGTATYLKDTIREVFRMRWEDNLQ